MSDPHLRAADTDRAAVADRLGAAMSTGRLTLSEFDERLTRAHAARTYGELAELTRDLPPTPSAVAAVEPGPAAAHWCGGGSLRAAWGTWLATAALVLGIWLTTSAAAGDLLYAWPVWVIGPWGLVLVAQSLGSLGGRRRLPG
jgi:hypothetical protein